MHFRTWAFRHQYWAFDDLGEFWRIDCWPINSWPHEKALYFSALAPCITPIEVP